MTFKRELPMITRDRRDSPRGRLLAMCLPSAHEFWLEPTAFMPGGGQIGVYVCNGSGFEGWSLPRSAPDRGSSSPWPDGAHRWSGRRVEPAGSPLTARAAT
jgi:hypothetical protein